MIEPQAAYQEAHKTKPLRKGVRPIKRKNHYKIILFGRRI
jgi:hypothetical protein